ncbi:DNA-binding protein [Lactococcus garvieae]|uniref:DNA-binding protein n=1 Tax=Lactococcus garvieae TaxID=1363 RepID=UPI0028909066|nr:DNA-binding protein [Lactococcus garvieae]MDT2741557.1 DNA-binding protein [Lactococcus garvieae]
MEKLTIDERYDIELKKAEIDHRKPTAGAMLGHVLANLFMEKVRLMQAGIYAKNPSHRNLFRDIAVQEDEWFYKIADLLLNEGELVPSTIKEFVNYHQFITEDPKAKYWLDTDLVQSFIMDFNNQNMFITRAIKLAQKEEKYALEESVKALYGYNLKIIRDLAGMMGKVPKDFISEDDGE